MGLAGQRENVEQMRIHTLASPCPSPEPIVFFAQPAVPATRTLGAHPLLYKHAENHDP
jgi:hypothetical protein